ncbi:hypothetical protein LCGC14_0615090 [marine sediment metagenome]|uniref:Uncharacterized protein n=1 Tax=marine sediment metagenome TaxID=412755 RepID=A0A0F9RB89_9ZZZZ|nr:hypothetical protein [bacterium]
MKPQGKKQKGSKAERQFAQLLVDTGLDQYAKRMPLSGAVKGLDTDIMTKLPLAIEVKAQETWKPLEYYKQADMANPNRGRLTTIVAMTKNREPFYIFLTADDFLTILDYAVQGGWPDG